MGRDKIMRIVRDETTHEVYEIDVNSNVYDQIMKLPETAQVDAAKQLGLDMLAVGIAVRIFRDTVIREMSPMFGWVNVVIGKVRSWLR